MSNPKHTERRPRAAGRSHATGEMMYQDQRNRYGRRRGPSLLGCKPSGHVSGAGLVNGPVAPNGCKAPATKPSETTPNGTKVQFMVNGYIKVRCKGTETFRTLAGTETAAAGRENDGEAPVRSSVHRVSDPNPENPEQVTPEPRLPSAMQNKRKRKKFKRTKRDTEATCPHKCELSLLPPQEEENWENEIQDASFRVETYGPEDVLQVELQDLTLQQRDTRDLLATTRYSPAAHHPGPVHWVRHRIPTEPDQFADAEDAVGPLGCARLQTMVSPTMKALVDAVWAAWSIGASIYDYIHTNAMEERIHALENVITIHQCVIGLLSAGVLALFTYILFKKL